MFFAARWKPSFHFTFRETKPFLRFGINVAGSGSLIRVFESLDKFIVGRLFNARLLGFYGFAMSLASMPTDKIWPIFNQILFPLLSRYQDDSARCNEVFLKILKLFSFVIIPLYAMGIFFGKEILLTIVGAKWEMAIPFFKAFCVAKLFDSMNEFANLLHTSKGHPQRVLVLAIIKTITMPLCILFAALHSFASLTIPWAIVFPGLCIGWMIYTFEITKIKPMTFLKSVSGPCAVTLLMVCGIYGTRLAMIAGFGFSLSETQLFIQAVATGLVLFCGYVFLLDRKLIIETIRIFRS
jgi:O-antigen/teichoic acid export membrane protein